MSTHALVIGKFYPPHRGHAHLIETAARQCGTVTVLVMAARGELIPLAERVNWLRASFAGEPGVVVSGIACDVPVDYADPLIWAAQVRLMQAALARDGRPPVDMVFTSEHYGDELAGRFGARPVTLDPARTAVPVSASQIRADLAGRWADLVPAARAGLATRVVVVGAESTGTTTIARAIAGHYRSRGGTWRRTRWVPEVGRAYTLAKWHAAQSAAFASGLPYPDLTELEWTASDFDLVAALQTGREERAAIAGSPLLVCDTDAFATSVWERRYLADGARGLQPWASAALPRRDVYLLTTHEGVPWHDDGLREGDLAVRAAMTDWFAEALTAAGHSWVPLAGSLTDRLSLALRITADILAERLALRS